MHNIEGRRWIVEYTKLYETKDKIILRENKNGQMKAVVKPKFSHEQFVKTTSKHYSQKTFTQVCDPSWTDSRGWVYVENYVSRNGNGGGSGYWIDEDLFEGLTDAKDILIAEKLTREKKLHLVKVQTKRLEIELTRIDFSLSFLKKINQQNASE